MLFRSVSRELLPVVKTRGFGSFSQFYELLRIVFGFVDSFEGSFMSYCILFGVHRQFRGHFWHLSKLLDLVLSRSFMSYCILFWGPSTVSRAFLAVVKTYGFGPFSQFYELLHTVLGFIDSFEGISGIYQNLLIWSFLAVL